MTAAPLCEHSPCCLLCGMFGLRWADRRRKKLVMFAFYANVVALVLSCVAAAGGLTSAPSVLRNVPWVEGRANFGSSGEAMQVCIGASARYERMNCSKWSDKKACRDLAAKADFKAVGSGVWERTVPWSEKGACINHGHSGPNQCQKCKASLLSSSTLVMAIVAQLPTIATDLQRATRFGDVNCQATIGVLSDLTSFVSALASLLAFRWNCYQELPSKPEGLPSEGLGWDLGPGFQCLMAATILKAVDMLVHVVLPTPRQRWMKPNKEVVMETIDYLKLAPVDPEAPEQETMGGDVRPAVEKAGRPTES